MSEKSVDVLFVHIVYIKTKRYVHEFKKKRNEKSKALVAMVCKMKQKLYFTIRNFILNVLQKNILLKHD